LVVLGFELRAVYHLSHSTSPFFCDGCFQDRVSQTICLSWLWIMILLISASWVAGITGVTTNTQLVFIYLTEVHCCSCASAGVKGEGQDLYPEGLCSMLSWGEDGKTQHAQTMDMFPWQHKDSKTGWQNVPSWELVGSMGGVGKEDLSRTW
jgi:hypothetical protein